MSSALVGLDLTAQVSSGGTVIEDFLLGRAINHIRHYYLEHAGGTARYFMFPATTTQPA